MQQQPPQGSPTQPPQPGQARAVAQAPRGSVAQPGPGKLLFEGTARHSAQIGSYLKWAGISIAGGALAIFINQMDWGVPGWALGLFWLVGLPGLAWTYVVNMTSKYKVTGRRVETEHGVFARKVESLELWRVLDVEYTQSLIDRIFKNGRIRLISTDQTNPELILHGLPNHRQLFEELRDAVQDARQTNRPMELVPGSHGGDDGGFGEMLGGGPGGTGLHH